MRSRERDIRIFSRALRVSRGAIVTHGRAADRGRSDRAETSAPGPSASDGTSGDCPLKRSGIFERDEYRCVYCGEQFPAEELTLDHVQPRVRGGDRSEGNLVTACRACNTLKGQRRLSDFSTRTSRHARISSASRCTCGRAICGSLDEELAVLDRAFALLTLFGAVIGTISTFVNANWAD